MAQRSKVTSYQVAWDPALITMSVFWEPVLLKPQLAALSVSNMMLSSSQQESFHQLGGLRLQGANLFPPEQQGAGGSLTFLTHRSGSVGLGKSHLSEYQFLSCQVAKIVKASPHFLKLLGVPGGKRLCASPSAVPSMIAGPVNATEQVWVPTNNSFTTQKGV